MLGWHISVYKQGESSASPATAQTSAGARLAVWQTGIGGLHWLDELVEAGKAIDLGGNGYPCRYTATAEHLIPRVIDGPPQARNTWMREASDVVTDQWAGRTIVDHAAAAQCRPEEWLLVEAWDES